MCTARLQTGPPTPAEAAFVRAAGQGVPASSSQLLNAGRTICSTMGGLKWQYVSEQVAAYLGIDRPWGTEVALEAQEKICPNVQFYG